MVSFPNAKINIGLRILRKRPDGYHDIQSIFVPVAFADVLEMVPASKLSFQSAGLTIPEGGTNSCVKAWELLNRDFDIPPVDIFLLKRIPTGAGLGGGSADGAFTLKMLNDMFGLKLQTEQLELYALQIGSDCPFFIRNMPALAEGRGEILQPLDIGITNLSEYYILMIFPGIHISTPWAYGKISPYDSELLPLTIWDQPVENWKSFMVNDFEAPVFAEYPLLAKLKDDLFRQGAMFAAMSGSGSTMYAIFKDAPQGVDMQGFASEITRVKV